MANMAVQGVLRYCSSEDLGDGFENRYAVIVKSGTYVLHQLVKRGEKNTTKKTPLFKACVSPRIGFSTQCVNDGFA